MPVIYHIVILLLVANANLFAQSASIDNINFRINHNRLVVDYDLTTKTGEPQDVLLYLWDDNYNIVVPNSVFGDIGNSVEPGLSRQVTWDMVQDNQLLYGRLRPHLVLKDEFYSRGGSSNVIYSVLVPGLGGYFVADHRDMKFKPYLRTLSSLSLLGLGIKATQMRTREPLYLEAANSQGSTEERFYGYGSWDHWLFPYDNALFLGLGAAIWIYDIIWVANRGGRNDKLRKAFDHIDFNYNHNNREVGLFYRF